jgi:scyllo-inositol 2-dehydrogenase (NADP+)
MRRVAWIVDLADQPLAEAVQGLRRKLAQASFTDIGDAGSAQDLAAVDAIVVWVDRPLAPWLAEALANRSRPILLVGPTLTLGDPNRLFVEAAGLLIAGITPIHDIRVRSVSTAALDLHSGGHKHAGPDHTGDHEHVRDRVPLIDKVLEDVAVLLVASVGLVDQPVLTWRPATSTAAWTLGSTPEAVADHETGRMFAALLRLMSGTAEPPVVRVGLLGYGAIGHEHSRAVRAVPGLELTAVCDSRPDRLTAATAVAPDLATTSNADALIQREDVDLVVVSTAPDTHAHWALRAVRAGKHVIVEKPFALRSDEADQVLSTAAEAGTLAVVYQNRRYDPDHLAVRRLVRSGAVGEVFHVEAFIGGYGHPCNQWHSDDEVSGGVFYDWGSHIIDQLLDLNPGEIEFVTGVAHKKRWFDVTNADHSRTIIHYKDGVEAEFVYSDLAAARKPRWYVLGSMGAIVGDWRIEKVVSRNDIGTLQEDVLAAADSPPLLRMFAPDGSVTHVATPLGPEYGFHREVADRLRFGLPMSVTGQQSRRVLAVMEAARRSAAEGGRPVVPR